MRSSGLFPFTPLIIFSVFAGCASQNKYIEPEPPKPNYSASVVEKSAAGLAVVERGQANVWQQLIAGASKAGFIVESPNQNAWTLQVRYSGDPRDYIDCGRVVSKVKTAKGEKNYDFPAAKGYQQYQLQQGNKVFLVDRRMSLEARATVGLEQLNQWRTRVKMDSQYTATRDQSVQGGGAKPFGVTNTISFSSSGDATFPNAATKCRATGKFESDIMALMRR